MDISYVDDDCPLCEASAAIDTLREEYKSLEDELKHVTKERDDLANRLHDLETNLRESVRLARQIDIQEAIE